jgi:putative methanogen marker protein 4
MAYKFEMMNMLTLSKIQTIAQKEDAKIGIGDKSRDGTISRSCEIAQKKGFAEIEVFHENSSLVEALRSGEIDGAVRGTFESKSVLAQLKAQFGLEKTQRIVLLSHSDDRLVLLAPVGIDEGQSLREKKELVVFGRELLQIFGDEVKLGVLSGGRLDDFGRSAIVDESIELGKILNEQALEMGIASEHFGILLEKAIETSNFIMAPDGISGNLIFRAMHFFGGAKAIGAPISNLPRVFVDTSRAKSDYSDSIALASALCQLYRHTKL